MSRRRSPQRTSFLDGFATIAFVIFVGLLVLAMLAG